MIGNQNQEILERGVEEIIEAEHLKQRLERGDKLRVKLGIDPTAKDLHLGHTVVLRKLKQFQDAGHQAVLIIGDFTAQIGDPSGRSDLRPELTEKQIKENMKDYLKEVGRVLNIKKTEIRHNADWYAKKGVAFLMELASKFTVARSLERDDFQKRIKDNRDIGLLELLYPILQGYDSVEIKADVELGGTDQKFNLLMGRKVQRRFGAPEQDIITLPLIEGIDGVRKMSKSLGNYIGLSEPSQAMFNKVMAIPDDLMVKYFTALTDVPLETIERLKKDRLNPSMASQAPKEWKKKLAAEIVKLYHGEKAAGQAQAEFKKVFSEGQLPSELAEFKINNDPVPVVMLLKEWLKISASEAKRLVDQGGVKVNDQVVTSWDWEVESGDIVKAGPRRFVRVV